MIAITPNAIIDDFAYASTIDPAITDLYAKYAYLPNSVNLPVIIVMHGFKEQVASILDPVFNRMAKLGMFVCAVGMRGRDSASGSKDASARELYDIYDAITYIKANFASIIDSNQINLVGYSGGGGNAFGCACKFPDTFNILVSHFGMSDYGHDATDGWWQEGVYDNAAIESYVGGNPATVPNNYYARAHVLGVTNFTGGFLYMFHDAGDDAVPIKHSQNVKTAMDNASLTNYMASFSAVTDKTRWLHSLPQETSASRLTEDNWALAVAKKKYSAWTIPASGTIKVLGYIVTKRFSIWLGDGTGHAADVTYNTATDSYTVTPLTGEMEVVINQGAKTVTQTISTETTLTVV